MSDGRGAADATLSGALDRTTKITQKKVIFEICNKNGFGISKILELMVSLILKTSAT